MEEVLLSDGTTIAFVVPPKILVPVLVEFFEG